MRFGYVHLHSATWCYKKAVTTLFSRQHHTKMWYLGNDLENIDSLLYNICPSNKIQWAPRSIKATVKY